MISPLSKSSPSAPPRLFPCKARRTSNRSGRVPPPEPDIETNIHSVTVPLSFLAERTTWICGQNS